MSWNTFLRAHREAIAAADFSAAEVLTLHGLIRDLVFFVIELKTRRVEIAGIVPRSSTLNAHAERFVRSLNRPPSRWRPWTEPSRFAAFGNGSMMALPTA